MTLYDAVQVVIVGAAVVFSSVYALGRVAPGLRKKIGTQLSESRYPHWVNAIGVKLGGAAGGCGSGCSSCNSCGPAPQVETTQLIKVVEQR
jgi:hypothetical protein